MMKIKQDNDINDHTVAVNIENKTKMSWQIRLGMVYDKNQMGERRGQSYKFSLRRNQN